jgi:hypothetical protein
MRRDHATDEEVGIRANLTAKDRAVQRATELMRHVLADEWAGLSDDDIELVGWALGELWAASPHGRWEKLRFGHVSADDFRRMLSLAKRLRQGYSLWLVREMETLFTREAA